MERESFLGLATEVDDALGIKLEFQYMFVIGLEPRLLKSLEHAVEQEQILVLGIIRHHYQKRNYSEENVVYLPVRIKVRLRDLSYAGLYQRSRLRDEVVREGHLAEVEVKFQL